MVSISSDYLSDTVKINIGSNKLIEIITPLKDDVELLKNTDVNALVKSTLDKVGSKDVNLKKIEIQFDDSGDSKMIISADSHEQFMELPDIDYNSMVVLMLKSISESKGKDRVVVDKLTTEQFRLEKTVETKDLLVIDSIKPKYMLDTTVVHPIKSVKLDAFNNYALGLRKNDYFIGNDHSIQLDLGINNWLQDGKLPQDQQQEVKFWGSTSIGLKYCYTYRFGKINRSPFSISFLTGVNWYNFKFRDRDTRLGEEDNLFYKDPMEDGGYSDKSKLTVSYWDISIMPNLLLGDFRIAAGAYAGVRMGAHAKYKVKGTDDKNKQKDHSISGLNRYRYGARFEIGSARGLLLFTSYDINTLFQDDIYPKLNPITMGLVFLIN